MLSQIPVDFVNFIFVAVLSLLIGLEQRKLHYTDAPGTLYGTDRTHTFIGLLGFVTYIMDPISLYPYMLAGMAIVVFLSIFYWKKIETRNIFGITSMLVVLLTYAIAPLLYLKPLWLTLLLVTTILIFTELKQYLWKLSAKFQQKEFMIVSEFLLIVGIVLPLLPKGEISEMIPISPFKVWLSVVLISGISYASYLIQKFFFPNKGTVITGILGGLYSSTATTIVLAKKSKREDASINKIASAIFVATAMMFLRIWVLAFVFNAALAKEMSIAFITLTLLSVLISFLMYKFDKNEARISFEATESQNPLEFKTALVFAVLFVFFGFLTKFVMQHYGLQGLNILSFIVGVTDIDPFLLSLFTGKYEFGLDVLAQASLIAITSNNFIKMLYGFVLGSPALRKPLAIGFAIVMAAGVAFILW